MRLAVLLFLLLPTAAASAATVEIAPPAAGSAAARLVYTAAPGEANAVTITYSAAGDAATVTDPGATIQPRSGCTAADPHTATCEAIVGDDSAFGETRVFLGDLDDSLVTTGGGELRTL